MIEIVKIQLAFKDDHKQRVEDEIYMKTQTWIEAFEDTFLKTDFESDLEFMKVMRDPNNHFMDLTSW